jgi:hypothetical protein
MELPKQVKNLEEFDAIISKLDHIDTEEPTTQGGLSSYEFLMSKCAAYICCCTGDRFQSLQKILLKHIFSESDIRSFFASDLYMFTYRLIHPDFRVPMCQIVMNLCKIAPPEALTKGAALIKRMKNPDINFLNPKYADILQF